MKRNQADTKVSRLHIGKVQQEQLGIFHWAEEKVRRMISESQAQSEYSELFSWECSNSTILQWSEYANLNLGFFARKKL